MAKRVSAKALAETARVAALNVTDEELTAEIRAFIAKMQERYGAFAVMVSVETLPSVGNGGGIWWEGSASAIYGHVSRLRRKLERNWEHGDDGEGDEL